MDDLKLHKWMTDGNKRSSLPVLKCVAVSNGEMLSTDLETTLITPTDLTDGLYEFRQGKLRLSNREDTDFPEVHKPKKFSRANIQRTVLTDVRAGIPIRDPRKTLLGAGCEFRGSTIRVATTNGKLAFGKTGIIKKGADESLIVPGHVLDLLAKMTDVKTVALGKCTPPVTRSWGILAGARIILFNQIDGTYPTIDQIIPGKSEFSVSVDAAEFVHLIRNGVRPALGEIGRVFLEITADAIHFKVRDEETFAEKGALAYEGEIVANQIEGLKPGAGGEPTWRLLMPLKVLTEDGPAENSLAEQASVIFDGRFLKKIMTGIKAGRLYVYFISPSAPVLFILREAVSEKPKSSRNKQQHLL